MRFSTLTRDRTPVFEMSKAPTAYTCKIRPLERDIRIHKSSIYHVNEE